MNKEKKSTPVQGTPYTFEGNIPLKEAIPLGLQHVMAMFVGNLTPLIIIMGACGLTVDAGFADMRTALLQNAMTVAGIVTLVQLFSIGPIGGQVPIIMGTSSGFLGVFRSVAATLGSGVIGYGAILGASVIGGLFETVLGFCLKPLRKFFPPVVTGCVVMSIGLSLIPVGINYLAGGSGVNDFGSLPNLFVGMVVLITILILKHFTNPKKMLSTASILIGILVGYALTIIMTLVLPHTGVTADGVEYTYSWVVNFDAVKNAAWFSLPSLVGFGALKDIHLVFDARAILPICIMFIVTAVETVGDISGCIEGGMDREATDTELSGGVTCDGLGSTFAAFFGVLPNTSFSQNVGLVSMTKVVNRFALACGAVFLILCGLCPKIAACVSIMPQSVLGGAAVMMFASIFVSGIQLVTKKPVTSREITIISVALGLGYGLGSNAAAIASLPEYIQLIFGGSGIVPAAIAAIVLNVAIPENKK
jgi:NCS2 family nucleobase:cation symporter-2